MTGCESPQAIIAPSKVKTGREKRILALASHHASDSYRTQPYSAALDQLKRTDAASGGNESRNAVLHSPVIVKSFAIDGDQKKV